LAIQTFIPQSAIEAFYVSILDGLAWLNELQPHPTFCAPGRQCPTAKPWPIVQNDGFRQSALAGDPIQYAPHS
jgi:hypothetical protein